jgi:hypothetical protein
VVTAEQGGGLGWDMDRDMDIWPRKVAWRYRSPTLLFDELAEMSEIVGVGLDRQFGCVPFDLQIIEEGHLR